MQTAGDIREAAAPIAHVAGDPRAGFGQFTLIRDLYQYDPVPLDAKIEATDEGSPYWKKQTVSFAGPSGAGRISAFFFIPKNASPPYQTVVFFPSSYARDWVERCPRPGQLRVHRPPRFNLPPEIQTSNFMPRVTTPVLLINGTNDFAVPPAHRRRFLELPGTPAEHKKLVELEGGHVPVDVRRFFRETLQWYDKYLGPVK